MKSVPLAHVLCELHVEENKTFDDALISFECLMKEIQDEDVNACWRQNSDDVRQRQNT